MASRRPIPSRSVKLSNLVGGHRRNRPSRKTRRSSLRPWRPSLPRFHPPQPAAAANPGLDPGTYPAAPRDYARYRSWSWAAAGVSGFPQGLDDNQLRDAVSQQLDQRGLRPARPGSAADLQVSAFLRNELRTRQVTDY